MRDGRADLEQFDADGGRAGTREFGDLQRAPAQLDDERVGEGRQQQA